METLSIVKCTLILLFYLLLLSLNNFESFHETREYQNIFNPSPTNNGIALLFTYVGLRILFRSIAFFFVEKRNTKLKLYI